jgi:putative restriction endonuclease
MARGVFLHRSDSIYDDRPEVQYQFPKLYFSRAAQFVGDWIIYYEPRRGPTAKGYFAIARVERIVPDPSASDMYLALIEPGSYLSFERDVAFSGSDGPVERGVLNEFGKISGRAQAAVRPISIEDFNRILDLGIPDEEPLLPREGMDPVGERLSAVAEGQAPFAEDVERERVKYFSSRVVRDRVFRRVVLDAYDRRCAITGLKLINGGGRAEAGGTYQAGRARRARYHHQWPCAFRDRALDVRSRADHPVGSPRCPRLASSQRHRWRLELGQRFEEGSWTLEVGASAASHLPGLASAALLQAVIWAL